MASARKYFKAILPLRLEWEPCYVAVSESLPDPKVGDRVLVPLAGRKYHAVVSETDATPDIAPSRIQNAIGPDEGLESISEEEIRFWRFLSDYYMVPVGEIYKIAYPATLIDSEKKKARSRATKAEVSYRTHLDEDQKRIIREVLALLSERTVLLQAEQRVQIYIELIKRTSGSVLLLCPEIDAQTEGRLRSAFGDEFASFGPDITAAARRDLARDLRQGRRRVIYGTRGALFLPFSNLSEVIVDEEQDPRHKQENREPRMHTRDAAAILASIYNAALLLGSGVPSLDSLYNARFGRYALVSAREIGTFPGCRFEVIDTKAELRKNGMRGNYSRILLARVIESLRAGGKIMILVPWNDTSELEIELRELLAEAGIKRPAVKFKNVWKAANDDFRAFAVVAIIHAEYLVRENDFRGDEKAARLLRGIASHCLTDGVKSGALLIQCTFTQGAFFRNSEELLAERKAFGLPPFSRIVDIRFSDKNPDRLAARCEELTRRLRNNLPRQGSPACSRINLMVQDDRIRVILPKDQNLSANKSALRLTVTNFCNERKYSAHICLDVDPA